DLANAGIHALPVEDRREEDQQHDLAVDVDVAERRDQTQQRAEEHEQHRRTDAIAPAQQRPHNDGGNQRNDDDESKHSPIFPYESPGRLPSYEQSQQQSSHSQQQSQPSQQHRQVPVLTTFFLAAGSGG